MGYSCTAKASLVMDAVMSQNRHENSGNVYKGANEVLYFWERGRENANGAMTGAVMKMLPDGMCHRAGSYRIEPDGHISRFPGLTAKQRKAAEEAGAKRYTEVFEKRNFGAIFDDFTNTHDWSEKEGRCLKCSATDCSKPCGC